MEEIVDVSAVAAEVDHAFGILRAPVALTFKAWDTCVRWEKGDSEMQVYQEQDARLWDVLFVCGTTLQLDIQRFVQHMRHPFSVWVVPRDGVATAAVKAEFIALGSARPGMLLIDLVQLVPEAGSQW